MKLKSVMPVFASLLLAGSLVNAATTSQTSAPVASQTDDISAIFAPVSTDCPDAQGQLEPILASAVDPSCGMCSAPACQGASWTAYCGVTPTQQKKYCQPTQMCTGEGIGKYRCLCVVGGDIIP